MIYLIIYLIGFVLTYYMTRINIKRDFNVWTYKHVIIALLASLFSWIGVLWAAIIMLVFSKKLSKEPPKWL